MVYRYEDRESAPIPGDPDRLHIQNREIDGASVVFTSSTCHDSRSPRCGGHRCLFVLCRDGIGGVSPGRTPGVGAGAIDRQERDGPKPLYLLLLAIGLFGVLLFGIYPFNTMGDDIRNVHKTVVSR